MVVMVKILIKNNNQIELENSLFVVGLYEDYKNFEFLNTLPVTQSLY